MVLGKVVTEWHFRDDNGQTLVRRSGVVLHQSRNSIGHAGFLSSAVSRPFPVHLMAYIGWYFGVA